MSPEWMSNWRERSGWSLAARGTAALTVFCFVLTQLPLQVFAQHPELPEWLKEEQGGWVSAEQAQRLHKADAELLTFLSTLEQSKERLVTASASGIQTLHAGGQPVVSRDTANNLLFKPTVEIASPAKEQGGLAMTGTETISGTLLLADSTLQDIKEGRIVRKVDPFGTETFFDVSERPLYEIAPDGTRTDYGYVIASPPEAGEAISFSRTAHLATGDLTQRFDAQGRLTELSYPDGKAFFYTEGRLASARVNGATFLYTHAVSPDGSVTATLEGGQGADLPRRLIYDSDGSLQEVLQADGTLTRFLQGVPTEVIAPDGTTTQYKVSGTGVDFLATRQQVERRYDSTGLLTGLTLADQTRLTIVNDRLETIQLPDGSTITDGVFDADSRVVSGTVTLPNGRQVRYLEGQPTEALLPDGTTIGYTNGQPSLLNLPSGLSYTLTHESDRWLATLTQTVPPNNVADPPSTVAEPDTDLTPPDPYTTALTLTRALEDGTIAQYERQALGGQSPAGTVPWTLTQLVIASTSETGEAISQVITSPQDPAFKERYDPDPPPPPPTYSELLEPNHSLSPINDVGAAPGRVGSAAHFTRANNQRLGIADTSALSAGDVDFSFAGWIYLDTKMNSMYVLAKTDNFQQELTEYSLRYDALADRLKWSVYGSSTTTVSADYFGTVPTGTWLFVTAWHDSVNNTIGIQVNDGAPNTATHTGGANDTVHNFRMGHAAGASDAWDGRLDELGLWKRLLTPEERSILYQGQRPNPKSSLAKHLSAYWTLDEPSDLRQGLTWGGTVQDPVPPPPPRPVYATLAEHPALAHLLLPSDEPSIRQLITEGTLVIARSPSASSQGDEAISQGQIASPPSGVRNTVAEPGTDLAGPPPDTLARLVYSEDWELLTATRVDEAELAYLDGLLSTLTQSNGLVVSYSYDEMRRIASTIAASPNLNEPLIRTEYSYDRIRKVFEVPRVNSVPGFDSSVLPEQAIPPPLSPPDPYTTALTLTRALEDGTIAQYERQASGGQSPAGTVPWTLTQLTLADGTVITDPSDPAFKERYDPDPPPPPPTYSELLEPNHSLSPINDVGAAPGRVGSAAHFTRANNQRLGIADTSALSAGDVDFSFAGWIYLDTKMNSMYVLAKTDNFQQELTEYSLRYDALADRLKWSVYGSSTTTVSADYFGTVPTGTWLFVTAWHDSVNNTIGIQVNDGAPNTATHTGGANDTVHNFRMGHAAGASDAWDGRLDELGFWKRLLTPEERAALYQGERPNPKSSLAKHLSVYWTLDESSDLRQGLTWGGTVQDPVPPPPPRPVYATLAEHPALAHLLLPSDEPSIRQLITEGTLVIARSPSVGEGDEAISQGQIASASPRDDPDPTAPQLLYDYAYEFDADSSEITVIKELATGLTKRYREGLLISQTDPDGAVTAYEYTTDPAGYSDPLNEALATAAGAAQTLASGAVIHYARASSVQPWQVVGLTTPDGRYLTKPDSLSPYPLADPSFESWSQGGQQAPDGWRWSGGSGNSVSQETDPSHVRQETSSVQLGTPPLKLANGSDGSDYSFIYQDILPPYSPEVRALAGRTFTLEVWVKSDRPGAARIGLSSNEYDFSAFHPGDNEWHLLTITHTITTGSINFNAWIKVNGFEASAYFDNAQLIEGPAELLLLSDPAQLRSLELPADRASLRRLVEQGTLSLRGGEVESVIASAEGAKQSQDEIALASLHSDHSPVLSRAVVTYQGKPRETFTYSYSDVIASPTEGGAKQSLTRITDSSGAIRTYSDNNLIAIEEPSGTRWEVSYAKDLAQDQLETLRSLKPETIHYTDLQGREQSLQIQVPDLSAFNEQRGAQVTIHRLARLALPEGQLLTEGFPDDAVIEREFGAEGQLLTQTFASGMVTLYEESRPILTLDSSGRITTTFDYDAAGRLTKTTLIGARQEIFDQITNAEAEVIQRRTQALEELARQKGVAYQDLANRASAARAQLTDQQASLQHKLNDVEAMKAKGKAGKSAKSQAMDQIRAGMNQVRDALSNLDNQYAEALGQLNAQVESVRQEVESQTIQAFTEIHVKQVELAKAILRQELTTILIRAYRDTIGRDPSEQEVTQEVERLYSRYGSDPSAKVDLADLTQRIRVLPDYAPRASDVSEIKRRVASWLQDYVVIATGDTSVISSEARNLISSLGLTPSEIVPLSASDIDRILAWLDSNSLHFGYSAFLPLKEYIEAVIARSAEGGTKQSPDFTTLAVQTLLVDILTGTINPKTTGDMELSLFALQRVAKLHGASATPSRVSFEDLRALVIPAQAGIASPVIAHINGNHYILVTVIAADGTVTYREPNAGPTGQTLTMTQAEFLQVWQGAILSSRAPPHAYQVLTDPEAQRITGSFFFMFFIFLAKLAVGVVSAISTAISFITGALATLVNTIGAAFTALGNAMGPLGFIFNGLGTMVSGLGHALGGLTYLLGGQFALGFETLFQGIGMMAGLSGGLSLQGLGQFALQTAVNLGVSTGLQALGVDPGIAGIAGSFASGGVQSFSGGSFHLGFDYSSALTSTAVAGTQLGLVKAGLDPALAGIASIGVGSIVGSLTVGTQVPKLDDAGNVVYDSAGKVVMKPIPPGLDALGTTLKTQLAPTLAGELAFYGIQKLGESIGLDPRISQLAGMPIKSAVTVGTAGGKATDITKSISDGLLHGATSLGIDLLGDEIGLDPFTQALSANVISGAISGAFKYEGNVFKGVSESLKKSVLNFSTPGTGYDPNAPYNPVQQATYLAKINDFSNIIRERGITTALETYASSIFQRDAIESIWKLGGIADFLLGNAKAVTLEDGRLTTEVTFKENSKLYLDATTDAVLARSYFDPTRGLVKEISSPNPNDKSFGLDEQGRFGLVNGKVLVNTPSGITEEYTVYGGNIVLIEGRDTATGKTRYFVSPREGSDTVRVSPDGRFIEGQVVDLSEDYKFGLLDGDITREIALRPTIIYSSGQIVDAKIQAQGFSDLSPEKLHALAQAMEAAVPPLHDPTPEQRTAAQQAAPQFLAVVKEELTKLVGAENAEAMLKSFGPTLQTLIENPDALPAEQARLQQEQATLTVSKEQASTALSRAMEKGINWLKTQGDSFADDGNWVAGGTLHTIAAAVDLFGDDLRIGVGIQQAKQAAAEGHYGAATMYLLQDGLRAFGLFPAVGLATKGLGKSLQVASKATGIVGDVPTAARSLDRVWGSIKNFFRIGSKVYDVGQGELKLTRTAWEFKAGNSVVKGAVHSADEATEVVYRAVPKGTSNPMRFSTAEGRFNSLDTKVLYTSKDKNVAVSEFLRRNPGAEYDVYEIALKDSRRITLDTLPAEQVSRSLGDTATRASDLGKIVAPSDINGSVNNVVVLREELIKEFNKVAP